jgi:membrane-bound serine protease (ClpP class)
MRKIKLIMVTALILVGLAGSFGGSLAQSSNNTIVTMALSGPLTPSWITYIERGLSVAEKQDAQLLVIQINTPGGSINIMKDIVEQIRNSPIPVAVYVAPQGAMAASAGTVITLAGHLAGMAPETTIGAASPVGGQGEDLEETLEKKEKEMLRATVRTLAQNRSAEAVRLAEDTIENATAVSVQEALDSGLVDIRAKDMDDFIAQINGRKILFNGEMITLDTSNAYVFHVEMSFIEQLLQLLTDPNILFLLLTIGIQAIFIELSHPGGWVAGFIGAVCLILAVYGMGVLPVNWFGILFLLVAFILFILEIKAVTHGALSAAGALSFVIGSLVLFNSINAPGFPKVSVPLVVTTGVLLMIGIITVLSFAIRAMRTPVKTGMESLVGKRGYVVSELAPRGIIQTAGEQWSAISEDEANIAEDVNVEVIGKKGIFLIVKKI